MGRRNTVITTTIESLLTIKPVLQKLANTSMPAREAFSILKMLKLVDKEYESIEVVQHKMLDTYGAKNEDGTFTTDEKGNYIIKKEGIEDYVTEMQAFLEEKVELNCSKINFSMLEKIDLTPAQMILIEDFIDE